MLEFIKPAFSILGGLFGGSAASEQEAAARREMDKAVRILEEQGAPPDIAREIVYREYEMAGVLTPRSEREIGLGPSAVSLIEENPEQRRAQREILNKMRMSAEEGLTAEDRANIEKIRSDVDRSAQARMQQILSQGSLGEGAKLQALLKQQQTSQLEASDAAMKMAALSSQRQREAREAALRGITGLRSQDFETDVTRAKAADVYELERRNAALAREQRNVERMSQADLYNLKTQQDIKNANTEMRNREKLRQIQAEAERYKMDYARRKGLSEAYSGRAGGYSADAKGTKETYGTLFSGGGDLAKGVFDYFGNKKKDNAPTIGGVEPPEEII